MNNIAEQQYLSEKKQNNNNILRYRKKARGKPDPSDIPTNVRKTYGVESISFIVLFIMFFGILSSKMGFVNLMNTMMNTAFDLLTNTVIYIMAIAVVIGGIAGLLTEFGTVAIINHLLSPLMKPLYHLPGASILGIITTYLSDNPAILSLASDENFKRYFKKYQWPALTNIGTAFGMGLIITVFMFGLSSKGQSFIAPTLIGNLGAVIGSIISTRLMLIKTKKLYGTEEPASHSLGSESMPLSLRKIHKGSIGERAMNALLEGGKNGVHMGITIIPGVLIICTFVMLLTNGPANSGSYTGEAYQGVAFLPWVAEKIQVILTPLFGFSSPECISVPITALGAAGAAIGLVPNMVKEGLATGNDIAVFTAMCMCWSGYLSTHVAMMDSLGFRNLTGHAILSHTIGGFFAGISAHFIYLIFTTL